MNVRTAILLVFVLPAACVTGAFPTAFGAEPAELNRRIAEMLRVGWESTGSARSAAADRFDELQREAPGNSHAEYAYALIQIRHHRYRQADTLLGDMVAVDQKDPAQWRAKAWLSVVVKDYPAALVALDRLGQLLPADDQDPADERAHLASVRFLGRVFGYLEGPVADAAGKPLVDEHKRAVIERLSDARYDAFEHARVEMLAQFRRRDRETALARREAITDQLHRKEQTQEKHRQVLDQADETIDRIDQRRDKLRHELDDEIDEIDTADHPLVGQMAELERRAAGARREFLLFEGDIQHLYYRAQREKDPLEKEYLLREADRLSLLQSRYGRELSVLEGELAAVAQQRLRLGRRRAQAEARFAKENGDLNEQLDALDRIGRRIEIEQKQLDKPSTGMTQRVRSMSARTDAFTTYEPFPLEQERQRLLDALGKDEK